MLIAIDEYKTKGLLKGAEVEVLMRDAGDTRESAEQAAANWPPRGHWWWGPQKHRDGGGCLVALDAAGIVVMAPAASAPAFERA